MKTDSELTKDLDAKQYVESYLENGQGDLKWQDIVKSIISLVFKEVSSVAGIMISIICTAVLCSLLKNLENAFSNESISNVAFYACYLVVIMLLSKSFIISVDVCKNLINTISDFCAALLPVIASTIGIAGGFTQMASLYLIILAAVITIPRIYSVIIIPLVLMSVVMEFANNISKEHKISNLCSLLKQSTIYIQGIILTVFIGILTIRGITSSTLDAVTLKSAKFAIDNFVPIVGKTFSDAISSAAGYSLLIKNALSSVGLIIILLLMAYPIIKIILMIFIYKISAALIEPISDSRITKSISVAGDGMVIILSCALSISFMFFILIAIMASSGRYVIGG